MTVAVTAKQNVWNKIQKKKDSLQKSFLPAFEVFWQNMETF